MSLKDGQWRSLSATEGLPSAPASALTPDGQDLWVGGMGYLALVDPEENKVRKFAYLRASEVDSIQVGGGYLWAKFDWHLFRAPLASIR